MRRCYCHLYFITVAGLMGKGFVEGNVSGLGGRCGVADKQAISKKKPDGFDKRVWLQTRRIRSSRRANCKASAFILNVAKKYVKNELKLCGRPSVTVGNRTSRVIARSETTKQSRLCRCSTLLRFVRNDNLLLPVTECIHYLHKRTLSRKTLAGIADHSD
jgi:hypothetical protein